MLASEATSGLTDLATRPSAFDSIEAYLCTEARCAPVQLWSKSGRQRTITWMSA